MTEHKAALLSAFVFPGIGHLYLKKYFRGLVILCIVFIGSGYVIWSATKSSLNRLDEVAVKLQGGSANLQELSDVPGSKAVVAHPYQDVVFYAILCFWIFAVIAAYRIGKQSESHGPEISRL